MNYDNFSQTFAQSRDGMHWGIIDQCVQHAQIIPTDTIGDIGCGSGRLYPLLPPHQQYFGSDISQGMIYEAMQRYPHLEWKCASMTEPGAYKPEMNCIFSIAAMHHLLTIHEIQTCLQLVYQSLVPKGRIIATFWNLIDGPDAQKYNSHPDIPERVLVPIGSYIRHYLRQSPQWICQQFIQAGFIQVDYEYDAQRRNFLVRATRS